MKTVKYISEYFDRYDGKNIDDYISLGGFETVKKVAEIGIEETVKIVSSSGVQGRGGAAYPTGRKLMQAREAQGVRKFVVCNADEGEPGTFKDRELLRKNVFQVIEGMIIAGICSEAKEGFIYIREEYTYMHDDIRKAIKACYDKNILGVNLLGTGYDFDIKLFSGAGAYVCGEGFALCESLEGRPGRPRTKPPFVKQAGFLSLPTLVINTETLSAIVSILRHGHESFKDFGTEISTGTKMISISGKVKKAGVYEIPFGLTISEIVNDIAGGVSGDLEDGFVQIGGASGGILPKRLWEETKYTYEDLKAKGLSVGSGAIVVGDKKDLRKYLDVIGKFFLHESCGKCTPCREGNRHLIPILDKIVNEEATKTDIERFDQIMDIMKNTSLCGSGKTQVVPFLTAKKYFPEIFS